MVELEYHNLATPNEIIELSDGHQWLLKTVRRKFYGEFLSELITLVMPEFNLNITKEETTRHYVFLI